QGGQSGACFQPKWRRLAVCAGWRSPPQLSALVAMGQESGMPGLGVLRMAFLRACGERLLRIALHLFLRLHLHLSHRRSQNDEDEDEEKDEEHLNCSTRSERKNKRSAQGSVMVLFTFTIRESMGREVLAASTLRKLEACATFRLLLIRV